MSRNIVELVDQLPTSNLTVRMLQGIDFVAPGEWHNLTGFANTIKVLTGEDDEAMVQKVGERAIALFNDKSQGYQRAQWLYEKVDTLQGWLGTAAMMNKVGERFSSLSFLGGPDAKALLHLRAGGGGSQPGRNRLGRRAGQD